jgi:hypothetical protein
MSDHFLTPSMLTVLLYLSDAPNGKALYTKNESTLDLVKLVEAGLITCADPPPSGSVLSNDRVRLTASGMDVAHAAIRAAMAAYVKP